MTTMMIMQFHGTVRPPRGRIESMATRGLHVHTPTLSFTHFKKPHTSPRMHTLSHNHIDDSICTHPRSWQPAHTSMSTLTHSHIYSHIHDNIHSTVFQTSMTTHAHIFTHTSTHTSKYTFTRTSMTTHAYIFTHTSTHTSKYTFTKTSMTTHAYIHALKALIPFCC